MKIEYISHSCFKITSSSGASVITDPFIPPHIYSPPFITCDAVLVSHTHPDHYNLDKVGGNPIVITGTGQNSIEGFKISGFLGDHGEFNGEWLGMVVCYKIEVDGLKCLHLSDIKVMPTDAEIAEFGEIDVLFVPTGGNYTLNAAEARSIADKIKPSVVIPMHYATAGTNRENYPIEDIGPFIDKRKDISFFREKEVEITPQSLPEKQGTWVLTPRM